MTASIPEDPFGRLDLFLNEALANVMDHGGPTALEAPIQLVLSIASSEQGDEATLTIEDGGKPFDPLAHTPRPIPQSLDEAVPGGLGIPMMRNLADDLHYTYDNNHNRLSFTVRWDTAQTAGAEAGKLDIQIEPFRRQDGTPPDGVGERRRPGISWLQLFSKTDEQAVMDILNECEVLKLAPGTPLLKPGTQNDSVYILLYGSLAAYLDSDANPEASIPIAPGECIGEMSAIDGKPVTALVMATGDAHVLKVTPELFTNRLLTVPGVARNLMVALTERMRRTNESMMEAQRKQMALQHLHKELEVARQLQASMLPRNPMFPERDDLEITALMEPASQVGGDLFDAFFVDDHHLFICVGDVSGHGIPAALFMARAIGLMRITAMGTLHPDEVMNKVNDQLCYGNDTNLFVTLFCGFLDVTTGKLVYSNGGHCAPILVSGDHAAPIDIPKGILIGTIPDLKYASRELTMQPGETLVCYTDGVTEAQTDAGEEFTDERLVELLGKDGGLSTGQMLDAVRDSVTAFTGNHALDDDFTLMAVRLHPAQPAS